MNGRTSIIAMVQLPPIPHLPSPQRSLAIRLSYAERLAVLPITPIPRRHIPRRAVVCTAARLPKLRPPHSNLALGCYTLGSVSQPNPADLSAIAPPLRQRIATKIRRTTGAEEPAFGGLFKPSWSVIRLGAANQQQDRRRIARPSPVG